MAPASINKNQILGLWPLWAAALAAALAALVQPRVAGAGGRVFLAVIFQAALWFGLVAALIKPTGRWLGELGFSRGEKIKAAGALAAVLVALAIFMIWFFQMEEDIKIYDHSFFWRETLRGRALMGDSIGSYFRFVQNSLGGAYSVLPAFPLILPGYLLGTSYTGYILSVLLVYYLPACFFLALFSLRLAFPRPPRKPAVTLGACAAVFAFNPALLYPLIQGYLDVEGVLILAILLNLVFGCNPARFNLKLNLAIAAMALLWLASRSWFEALAVGFFAALMLSALLSLRKAGEFTAKGLAALAANFIFIFCLAGLCFRFLSGQAPGRFSGFSAPTFTQNIGPFLSGQVIDMGGVLWLLAAIVGLVALLNGERSRPVAVTLLTAALLASVLAFFFPNIHWPRLYAFFPIASVFVAVIMALAINYGSANSEMRPVGLVFLAVVLTANFLLAYVPPFQNLYSARPLTVSFTARPMANPFAQAVTQMNATLKSLAGKIYPVGDSAYLSAEMLKRSQMPAAIDGAPNVLRGDNETAFPSVMFTADYLLVADPLPEGFMKARPVTRGTYEFLNDDGGDRYVLDREFPYPENAAGSYKLYAKTRPAERAGVEALWEKMENSINPPNLFLALFSVQEGQWDYQNWSGRIVFSKKPDEPIVFLINDTSGYSKLSFRLSNWARGMEMLLEDGPGPARTAEVIQGRDELYEFDIEGSQAVRITIIQNGAQNEADLQLTPLSDGLS